MLEHSPFDGSETYSLCVELEGTIILCGAKFDRHMHRYMYIYICLAFGVLCSKGAYRTLFWIVLIFHNSKLENI